MSVYILVLNTDLNLSIWDARNHNSDLNTLEQHPYFNPSVSQPVTKFPQDTAVANVIAIDVTGQSSPPSTIILLDSNRASVSRTTNAMSSKFASWARPKHHLPKVVKTSVKRQPAKGSSRKAQSKAPSKNSSQKTAKKIGTKSSNKISGKSNSGRLSK